MLSGAQDARKRHIDSRAEQVEHGSMRAVVYRDYLLSIGSWPVWLALALAFTTFQASDVGRQLWLQRWTRFDANEARVYIVVYAALAAAMLAALMLRTYVFLWRCTVASQRLFTDMLAAIVGSKPRFFDVTPAGVIHNRCAKDTAALDEDLSNQLLDVIAELFLLAGGLIAITGSLPLYACPLLLVIVGGYALLARAWKVRLVVSS